MPFRALRAVYRALPLPAGIRARLRDAYVSAFGLPRAALDERPAALPEKRAYCRLAEAELHAAEQGKQRLVFGCPTEPNLSVVVVVYNAPALTRRCLESVSREADASTEVVVVDNASDKPTQAVLEMVHGARLVRNGDNLHFIEAVNAVLPTLQGQYVLLLNNDVCLLPGAIGRAMRTLTHNHAVGAVGAQVLGVDGQVLELGCKILAKGECQGISRGADWLSAENAVPYSVDYVSGCFLLTWRDRLEELGGFDRRYAPAYYEDVDYCTELWKRGWQVVCDPSAMVVHYESAGSSGYEVAELVLRNRRRFRLKHDWHVAHQARRPGTERPAV